MSRQVQIEYSEAMNFGPKGTMNLVAYVEDDPTTLAGNVKIYRSGGGVVNFSGTTSEEADVTVGGQPARTSQVGTHFEKAVPLVSGTNTVTITAEDPSGNTTSQDYEIVVNGGSAQSFTYDANGNLTDDGARQYAWDAENRLIKITEGTKTTDIEYDGLHHWTRILEKNSGTTTSDHRFIWANNTLVEQRNGTSTTAAQRYFSDGVQQGSNKFFYTRDHLGSIREVMDNSGAVVARYDYDPYGRRTKLSGSFDSDFGFTGHYYHAPSGLHFAPFRAYNAELGRWISRDPIEERGGIYLYAYVFNNPINLIDILGLIDIHWYGNYGGPGWTNGGWEDQQFPDRNPKPSDIGKDKKGKPIFPIDATDACFMKHDICVAKCKNPDKSCGKKGEDIVKCKKQCNQELKECLRKARRKGMGLKEWLANVGADAVF